MTIANIESAKSFGLKTPAYSGFIMASMLDELIKIDLPIGPDYSRDQVLAQIISKNEICLQVLIDDSRLNRVVRTFVGNEISSVYNPVKFGTLSGFLEKNSEITKEIIEAGGIHFGNLTIARAVLEKIKSNDDADDCLVRAINISKSCQQWNTDLITLTK